MGMGCHRVGQKVNPSLSGNCHGAEKQLLNVGFEGLKPNHGSFLLVRIWLLIPAATPIDVNQTTGRSPRWLPPMLANRALARINDVISSIDLLLISWKYMHLNIIKAIRWLCLM